MFIDVPEQAAVDEGVVDWYDKQHAAWGYLPNYAPAFATRPDVAHAWNRLNTTIREGMQRRRFELATIAAARALGSTYCMAAHCKFLRDICDDEPTMRAIAADATGGGLDPTDRAVISFAERVVKDASSITADEVQRLRDLGLSDRDVADVVFAAAARAFFATVLDALGVQADAQLAESFDPLIRGQVTVGRPFSAQ
jgi:uncharacterized peroxidase-related enzyme